MKKILLLAAVTAAVAAASSCSKYDDVLESSAVRRNSDVMPSKHLHYAL